jgi:lactoylglutathione lyase
MKGVLQLAHVALKVKNLDASLDFYVNKLGFQEMMRLPKPDGSPGVWLVYLRITDDQYLELFPDGVGDKAPGREATGMNHLCIGVADIDSIIAELKTANIPLTVQRKMAADLNWQCWIDDPDGNRIEIMQLMPNCLQLEAIKRLKKIGEA